MRASVHIYLSTAGVACPLRAFIFYSQLSFAEQSLAVLAHCSNARCPCYSLTYQLHLINYSSAPYARIGRMLLYTVQQRIVSATLCLPPLHLLCVCAQPDTTFPKSIHLASRSHCWINQMKWMCTDAPVALLHCATGYTTFTCVLFILHGLRLWIQIEREKERVSLLG